MKHFYKAIALLLFPAFCIAQSNFKPGYVVTLKGDTLRGEIDYREWSNNPTEIRFKDVNGSINLCTPVNTSTVAINSFDFYKRAVMPLSADQIEFSNLPIGRDSTIRTDTVFLRKVTDGQYLTLYEYEDVIKKRYIVLNKHTNSLHELSYHVYLDPQNISKIITLDYYKNELIKYAMLSGKNDQSLFNHIRWIKYNNDIVKIVNIINNNTDTKNEGKKRSGSRWVLGASVNCSLISYSGEIKLARHNQLNKNFFPAVNIGYDFLRNASIGKFFFRLGASFYTGTFTASGYDETNDPSVGRIVYKQTFTQRAFTIEPDIFYNVYNTASLKAFMALGFMVRAYKNSNNTNTETDNNSVRNSLVDFPHLRALNMLLPLKAGIIVANKYQLYFNYEFPCVITDNYVAFNGSTTNFGLGINYLFGIK